MILLFFLKFIDGSDDWGTLINRNVLEGGKINEVHQSLYLVDFYKIDLPQPL